MFITEADAGSGAIPIQLVFEDRFEAWWASRAPEARNWAEQAGFRGERNRVVVFPDAEGRPAAVAWGIGRHAPDDVLTPWHVAGLPERLPAGRYRLETALDARSASRFAQGWAYGTYRYDRFRRDPPVKRVELVVPSGIDMAEVGRLHAATSLARDLINAPASHLSPEHLAQAVLETGRRYGAKTSVHVGEELIGRGFPAVHAVGRASSVAPRLAEFTWGDPSHPRIALVGKGVCFDSGGLDIKPPSGMLLMKKDMGGAACVIGLAGAIMDAGLPVRLHVVVPAVENAISGNAYRPGDVLATRKGLHVEVGNTDAEGRLVLADALALADEAAPELIIDMATLTGAARVALGPELPALFASDDGLAAELCRAGMDEADPFWQLPLWTGYDEELASKVADLGNVSSSGFSGAIIGALFLRRFVTAARHWVHIDLYGWNPRERPGRPVGAEAQGIRALYAWLKARYAQS